MSSLRQLRKAVRIRDERKRQPVFLRIEGERGDVHHAHVRFNPAEQFLQRKVITAFHLHPKRNDPHSGRREGTQGPAPSRDRRRRRFVHPPRPPPHIPPSHPPFPP